MVTLILKVRSKWPNPWVKNRIDEMYTYYDGISKLAVTFFLLFMKLLLNSVVQLVKAFDVLILTSKLTLDLTLFSNISNMILSSTFKLQCSMLIVCLFFSFLDFSNFNHNYSNFNGSNKILYSFYCHCAYWLNIFLQIMSFQFTNCFRLVKT